MYEKVVLKQGGKSGIKRKSYIHNKINRINSWRKYNNP